MLKKLMISAAVSALMMSGAMAQDAPKPTRQSRGVEGRACGCSEVPFVAERGSVGVLEVQGD